MDDFIENLKENNQYLYHYTKNATVLENILKERKLKFSNFMKTNDPFEYENFHFTTVSYEKSRPIEHLKKQIENENLDLYFKTNLRMLCFCEDVDNSRVPDDEKIYHKGFSRMRMWSQYGEDHKGVCLIFDKSNLLKKVEDSFEYFWSDSVEYTNRLELPYNFIARELIESKIEGRNFFEQHKKIFFQKAMDYKNEQEFRIIVEDDSENSFVDINDSLFGIIMGQRFNEVYKESLLKLTNELNVKYYFMNIYNRKIQIMSSELNTRRKNVFIK